MSARLVRARNRFPRALDPTAPAWLDPEGREVWLELVPALVRAGLVVEVDGAGLAILCWLVASARRCASSDSLPCKTEVALLAEVRAWLDCFLCTPAARARGIGGPAA